MPHKSKLEKPAPDPNIQMTLESNIKTFIRNLAENRLVFHALFWAGIVALYSLIESFFIEQGFFYTMSNNVVRLIILGAAVYYNIYVLIPKHLANKKFLTYLGFMAVMVFIITPVEAFFIYTRSKDNPEMQAVVLQNLNWSFLPNFFVVGTSTVVKITLDWLKNQREKQELETQTMQSELRFLKSQINPHFLFNTLNSLYALTLKKSDKAPDIVLKLSEMMRYMLYECNERFVPLSKEVSYIANYLELEKLRQGKNVDIEYVVEGNVSDQKIAPLMFIPFIENCFKHGVGNQLTKGIVNIRLKVSGNEVTAVIENSKAETMPKPLHARSGGIGLVNVRRRLELLYPGHYNLNIDDNPKAYTVTLKIWLDEF